MRVWKILYLSSVALVLFVIPLSKKDRSQFDDNRVGKTKKASALVFESQVRLTRVLNWEIGFAKESMISLEDATNDSQEPLRNTPVYSRVAIIQIIRDVWPDHLENRAIRIADRESNLRPRVIGIPNKCCYGLFQINYKSHKNWLPHIGITHPSQLLNPRNNAIAALEIYRRSGGWGPWQL